MTKHVTSGKGRPLPVLSGAPPIDRLNGNCKVVSRLGEPLYPSCRFCDLKIGNCLQFQGQLHAAVILGALLVMVAVSLPAGWRLFLSLLAGLAVVNLLRRVGTESQRLIVAQWSLREQAEQVVRRNQIFEITKDAEVEGARTLESFLARVVPNICATDRYAVLLLDDSSDAQTRVRVNRSGMDDVQLTRAGDVLTRWLDQAPADLLAPVLNASELPTERLSPEDARTLSNELSGSWLAPLRGKKHRGVLILWGPAEAESSTSNGFDGAGILATQTGLLLDNEMLAESVVNSERLTAIGEMSLTVAHEINNPLAIVMANRDRVGQHLEQLGRSLEERGIDLDRTRVTEVRRALGSIDESVERIRRTIHDMNALAGAGREEPEPLDVSELVYAAVERLSDRLDEVPDCAVEIEAPLVVVIDRYRFGQVLDNLLLNAARELLQQPTDQRSIKITVKRGEGGTAQISVEDSGPGVPPDLVPNMFNPFVTRQRAGQGSGLGLAVVKRVLESANGSIGYHRSSKGGAVFTIVLPEASGVAAEIERGTRKERVDLPGAVRVLIVDDEAQLRGLFAEMLGNEMECVEAGDGREALEAIERSESPFDVVICDLAMPVMGGVEFLKECDQRFPEMVDRVVLATGGATDQETLQFLQERQDRGLRMIQKPFGIEGLKSEIVEVTARAR